jgi:hypothetical protein
VKLDAAEGPVDILDDSTIPFVRAFDDSDMQSHVGIATSATHAATTDHSSNGSHRKWRVGQIGVHLGRIDTVGFVHLALGRDRNQPSRDRNEYTAVLEDVPIVQERKQGAVDMKNSAVPVTRDFLDDVAGTEIEAVVVNGHREARVDLVPNLARSKCSY